MPQNSDDFSKAWAQIEATNATRRQQNTFNQVNDIVFDAMRAGDSQRASNEKESKRLTELICEAVDLTTEVKYCPLTEIDGVIRINGWPDIYNPWLFSRAFGQPEGLMPDGLTVGCGLSLIHLFWVLLMRYHWIGTTYNGK
jgi:hypothetical protein